jgi:hypothetical protein
MGFFLRWLFAFVLLAATFNPTRWNYLRWAEANWGIETPLVVLLGLILVVAYVIYLRATFRSIGPLGMALVAALVGALVWVLIDWGVLTLQNPSLNTWLGLFALSVILGIGLSWSIVRRRLSGQVDMDDVDED